MKVFEMYVITQDTPNGKRTVHVRSDQVADVEGSNFHLVDGSILEFLSTDEYPMKIKRREVKPSEMDVSKLPTDVTE